MENLRIIRKKHKLSMRALGEEVGVAESTISHYETGKREPDFETLLKLGEFFDVSTDWLLGRSNYRSEEHSEAETTAPPQELCNKYHQLDASGQALVESVLNHEHQRAQAMAEATAVEEEKLTYLPLQGNAAAGEVMPYADPSYEVVGFKKVPKGAEYALTANGDSMEPLIANGGDIFYKAQEDVENGEIAIVEIDGGGAVCKRYYKDENGRVELRSINPKYPPVTEFESLRIIGRVLLEG